MSNHKGREPNRLIKEKSPYLLQHAYNPVDWYPWSEEAFKKAEKEDKPIFLSIGYSCCHWCHVMERESFEDVEVAHLLNRDYIAIKVDREERPDVDNIYMSVCQALTGHGGWPLTIIMTPEKEPFFAGTYFPKKAVQGMRGLMEILEQVARAWREEREQVLDAGRKITRVVQTQLNVTESGDLGKEELAEAYRQFKSTYDPQYGGFGDAPKFPRPHDLLFLLRYWKDSGEPFALSMVEHTLDGMRRGGIYDHVGFGFSRYSVDREWLVPHFEKMLYDNALLAYAYLEAHQATKKDAYARTAREIFSYVLRELTSEEGGFYSAEDADSEGEEGKFYVWDPSEVKEVLGEEAGELFCECYDITLHGNFEQKKSIPNRIHSSLKDIADRNGWEVEELREQLEMSRKKLFRAREERVHPHKDDKILTSWNGLMIAAFAKGARVLGNKSYAEAAEKSASFILKRLRDENGRLLARYRDGEAAIPGYVDDYAFLVWGLIELYEATFRPRYLQSALELTQEMLELFGDEEEGGLYFTGWDAEKLLTRTKEVYDGALPSGNSVAALNLARLARLTGDTGLREQADRQIRAFAGSVGQAPTAFSFFLTAVQFFLGAPKEIVIAGPDGDHETELMLRRVQQAFLPEAVLLFKPAGKGEEVTQLVPFLAEQSAIQGRATAYVCENYACMTPATTLEELEERL
ncbi:thioredoxin domain-containing protein [Kroppenstedtia guangzhouensis]|uniref:Thioredoxin domain-containing protein n=1 Tax=Kroppenstedtia guangzhouensis TaxID=1274356 RepID=A0ABQ1H3Y3_9BACL|nr:thioredoxin domain-containing protein [Kroppenstedtia guangzhouensis]GGA56833.1 thioredoxin domain-containing protein [Kroppenstedtia guangzhouensis]